MIFSCKDVICKCSRFDFNVFYVLEEFCDAVKELEAAAEIKEKIRKEIKRYKILSQGSAEANVERGCRPFGCIAVPSSCFAFFLVRMFLG